MVLRAPGPKPPPRFRIVPLLHQLYSIGGKPIAQGKDGVTVGESNTEMSYRRAGSAPKPK